MLYAKLLLAGFLVLENDAYFSPGTDCTKIIVREIDKSVATVFVQAYSFTDPEISAALARAKNSPRNLRVYVIVDWASSKQKGSQIQECLENLIIVRLDRKHKIAHNKIIILDAPINDGVNLPSVEGDKLARGGEPKWKDTRVITGSFDFSDSAQHNNAENIVVISDNEKVAKAYMKNWQEHWNHTVPYISSVPLQTVEGAGNNVPTMQLIPPKPQPAPRKPAKAVQKPRTKKAQPAPNVAPVPMGINAPGLQLVPKN